MEHYKIFEPKAEKLYAMCKPLSHMVKKRDDISKDLWHSAVFLKEVRFAGGAFVCVPVSFLIIQTFADRSWEGNAYSAFGSGRTNNIYGIVGRQWSIGAGNKATTETNYGMKANFYFYSTASESE